jgi:hypothetical protein
VTPESEDKVKRSIAAGLVVVALVLSASAKKEPKDYPLTGTVVSFHAEKEVRGSGGDIDTYSRRVYVLKTEAGELEITGWDSMRHAPFTKSKAQKRPSLSIGQKITYRTDGKFIWTVLDDGVEHRYYINSAKSSGDEK